MSEQAKQIAKELSEAEKVTLTNVMVAQHRAEVHAKIRRAVSNAIGWYAKNSVNIAIVGVATGLVLTTASTMLVGLLPVSIISGITLTATGCILVPTVAALVYAIISQITKAIIHELIPAIKKATSKNVLKDLTVDQAKELGIKIGAKLKATADSIQDDIKQELATGHETA